MDDIPTSGAAAPLAIRRVARQLEATFAAAMLKAARPAPRDGMFSGGTGAHSFDSFMDSALGDAMVSKGGFGLARSIERSMQGTQGPRQSPRQGPPQATAPGIGEKAQ
jgi:Rod binding domain-containing protein